MSAMNRHKMDNKNGGCSQGIRSYKNTRHGTPEGTRTPDLLIRSQSLYPTELLAHTESSVPACDVSGMERVMGIEPTCSAWKADILPLNYTRIR